MKEEQLFIATRDELYEILKKWLNLTSPNYGDKYQILIDQCANTQTDFIIEEIENLEGSDIAIDFEETCNES